GTGSLLIGVIGLIVVGATAPVAWMLRDFADQPRDRSGPSTSTDQWLAQIYENSMLSDAAKRVLFRDRELELLRRAIEEDIARGDHKRELENQFLSAAEGDDVEQAMLLLKQLDRYLTREEAGRLANAAQGVVVKHRDGLSSQFKQAVSDHRWAEAAQVGDVII